MTCGNNLCVFVSFQTTIRLLQIKVENKSCYRLKKNTIKGVKSYRYGFTSFPFFLSHGNRNTD